MKIDEDYLNSLKNVLPDGVVKEMAIPSYTHKNILIRKLFLKRLETILGMVDISGKIVLDYGTGSGVLLPYLSEKCEKVYAADVNIIPAKKLISAHHFKNVKTAKVNEPGNSFKLNCNHLDTIIAADVLEHVDDLPDLIDRFSKLIVPGGHLIVSGPTENWLYKIGRKIAGFKNEFHVRNIYDIQNEILKTNMFRIKKTRVLPNIFIQAFRIILFEKIKI